MNLDRKPLPRFWYFPQGLKARRRHHDRRRSRLQRRDARALRHYIADSPAGLLGGRLGVRPQHLVHLSRHADHGRREARALQRPGLRGEPPRQHRLRRLDARVARRLLRRPARRAARASSRACRRRRPTALTASRGATGRPSAEVEPRTASGSTPTTTTGRPSWVQDRPGLFTGSGMPMRFADLDGTMIDVYQAVTQMTDESGQTFPFTIDTLLDRALGPQATTACSPPTCTPTPRPSAAPTRSSPRRRRAACRSCRHGRCSTGSTAATARPSASITWSVDTLRLHVGVADRRERPAGDAADALGARRARTRSRATASRSPSRRRRSRASSTRSSHAAAGQYIARYPVPGDTDGDGWAPPADCNDHNAAVPPGRRSSATASTTTATARPTTPSPTSASPARRASVRAPPRAFASAPARAPARCATPSRARRRPNAVTASTTIATGRRTRPSPISARAARSGRVTARGAA